MKVLKKLSVILSIVVFIIIVNSVKSENHDSCGPGVTFPFSFLAGLFVSDKENTSDNGSVFAAEKAANIKVTFIELGSVNCIPCKMMKPIMSEIEKKYRDQVKVVFYDVWTKEGEPYGRKYGIKAIPTQVYLDGSGKEFFRHVGFHPFEEVEKILKNKGVR